MEHPIASVPAFLAMECRRNKYCILQMDEVVDMTHSNVWEPTLLQTPRLLFPTLHKEQVSGDAVGITAPVSIHVRRQSTRHSPTIYPTTLEYTGESLVNASLTVRVPICRMVNAHQVLPSLYSHIVVAVNEEEYDHHLMTIQGDPFPRLVRPARRLPMSELFPSGSASTMPTVPQRVLNAFIESAIAKGETCPVTMCELEPPTSFVTPCWHILSEGAIRWIEERSECPLCKQTCRKEALQQWKAL